VRFLVLVSGHQATWAERYCRFLSLRLAENGEVTIVHAPRRSAERAAPGHSPTGTVLKGGTSGVRVYVGGLSSALWQRGRRDAVLIVAGPDGRPLHALLTATMARLRGEKVVVEFRELEGRDAPGPARWYRMLLTAIAHRTARPSARDDESTVHTVVGLCDDDGELAGLLLRAFASLPASAAARWRLCLCVDRPTRARLDPSMRAATNATCVTGPIDSEMLDRATVVVTAHGSSHEPTVLSTTARGSAGIIVGHPNAQRSLRDRGALWLAKPDPASILVTIEMAIGVPLDAPGPADGIQAGGERLLSLARALA
jgi:hypothetical protein